MTDGSRWALLTFGAGLPNWRAAAVRLGRQAQQVGWFDPVIVLTDKDLRSQHPDFANRHKGILSARTRGYGYWIWKSYLIGEVWRSIRSTHAGLFYLDGGCQLNDASHAALERWNHYLSLAQESGVFAMHLPDHPEERWSRTATMDRIGLPPDARRTPQIQGGIVAITRRGADLVDEWQTIAAEDNYEFLRDSMRNEANAEGFLEHRHDQAIFSGLMKKSGIDTIPDETFWAPDWSERGHQYPIWAARNRTRVSIEARDPRSRLIRVAEKTYSRAYGSAVRGISRLHDAV